MRREEGSQCDKTLLCFLRAFSFLLLDSGQQITKSSVNNCVRVLKVALKAAKFCLDGKEVDLCRRMLERAASYLAEGEKGETGEDAVVHEKLKVEYYILRTALVRHHGPAI